MSSTLKRVSENTEQVVSALANTESRTFVAQLDIVVNAGLDALGLNPDGTPKRAATKRPSRPRAKATATG